MTFGAVFVHLAVQTTFSDVRRATAGVIAEAVARRPQLLNPVFCDALTAALTKPVVSSKAAAPSPAGDEQEKPVVDKRGRYATVLLSCASPGDEGRQGRLDKAAREVLVVNWVVLAHHPAICTSLVLERT